MIFSNQDVGIVQTPMNIGPLKPDNSPSVNRKSSPAPVLTPVEPEKSIALSSSSDCSLSKELSNKNMENCCGPGPAATEGEGVSVGSRILLGGLELSRDADGFTYFLIPAAQTTAELPAPSRKR